MKKIVRNAAAFAATCLALFSLQGCVKDSFKRTETYVIMTPIYETVQSVRENVKSNAPKEITKPGKIYMKGDYIFLNEVEKGIHVIDNSNPSNPRNIAFIDIPGCVDLAVKDNILYADLYKDLVAIDISDPTNVVLKKTVEGVFPDRYYTNGFIPDGAMIIVGWNKKDTTVVEEGDGNWRRRPDAVIYALADASVFNGGLASSSGGGSGRGGSMARFTIINDRMYTVGHTNMKIFNISEPASPTVSGTKYIGQQIETIYPFQDNLFIGSTSGMYIFNVGNPDAPVQTGTFSHVRSCDPVITDGVHAYVTLRSGSACQGFTNQLEVLKLTSLSNPTMVKIYQLTNPRGLSKDGNTLFICDGPAGLKVYNAADVNNLQLVKTLGGKETFDVIAHNGNALMVAADGLYQYDYSDPADIKLRSKIPVAVQ